MQVRRGSDWPADPEQSRARLLTTLESDRVASLKVRATVVAGRQGDDARWVPCFGRVDVARPEDLPAPVAAAYPRLQVISEDLTPREFCRRLRGALSGGPLWLGNVDLHAAALAGAWHGDWFTSGHHGPWPTLRIESPPLPSPQGIAEPLAAPGQPHAASYGELIGRVAQLPDWAGWNDARQVLLLLFVWDYRGRFRSARFANGLFQVEADAQTPRAAWISGTVTGPGFEQGVGQSAERPVSVEVPGPPMRVDLALLVDQETIDQCVALDAPSSPDTSPESIERRSDGVRRTGEMGEPAPDPHPPTAIHVSIAGSPGARVQVAGSGAVQVAEGTAGGGPSAAARAAAPSPDAPLSGSAPEVAASGAGRVLTPSRLLALALAALAVGAYGGSGSAPSAAQAAGLEFLERATRALGIGGLTCGIFFLLVRLVLTRRSAPGETGEQRFWTNFWVILLAFILGVTGIGASVAIGSRAPEAARKRVLLMDSALPGKVYDEESARIGRTNADDIDDFLRDLPLDIRKETTALDWAREEQVLRWDPDLVVMHVSCFYGDTDLEDGERKFRNFLDALAGARCKVIGYSRGPRPDHHAEDEAWLAGLRAKWVAPPWRGRFTYFPVDRAADTSFRRNADLRRRLKKLVKESLGTE